MSNKFYDFRNIDSQEILQALFEQTTFFKYKDFAFSGLKINEPEEFDGKMYQHIWIGECEYMGNITVADQENSGEDALFVQTLVRLFNDGKLKMIS